MSPVTLKCLEIIGKKLTFSERARRGLEFSAGPILSQLSPFGRYLASKSIVAKTAFREIFPNSFSLITSKRFSEIGQKWTYSERAR